ncbi:TonB-dependent receptor domain-containing protein [Acinetobacter shaoyimingii]|uniref:TonB-dependent receptor n=1 Tax=Acinetobacter shaoyimingii TaxID=2715164 RepID=A0A6G8RTH6_9GAMM|nr:TonB-dependent receptor [Acinetobacter shaoyimingii]QIO05269.1 TonB-dependent receptor [Acinetobacter shaoyimingii]
MNNKWVKSYLSLAILSAVGANVYAAEVAAGDEIETAKLKTIVVSATGYEQDVSQAPASITVIDRKELEKRNYNDINDVLRNTPGVVVTGNGSSQSISIRGMGSSYTLFLVNGKPQNSKNVNPNGDDNGFEKNILPPMASIERIEIIRGPASTLYGTDAMGGVVNIITKKVSDDWHGTVELGTVIQDSHKSGDIKEGSVYLSGPLIENKLGLQLGLNKQERDEDHYVSGFRGTKRESLNSRLTYVLNDVHDFELDANFVKQEGESTVGKTVSASGNNPSNSYSRNYRDVYSLTHNGHYSDVLESSSYIQYEKSRNPDRKHNTNPTSGIDQETLIANSQWNLKLGSHDLALGGYFKREELNDRATNSNPMVGFSPIERDTYALFAEDTWHLTDRFNLTGGLRVDYDENYGEQYSPRLYGVYNLSDAFTVKGGVSTGYKQPDIRAVAPGYYAATGGAAGNAVIRANPDLKPEESTSGELGFYWKGGKSSASLTGFYTDFKNKIIEERFCQSAQDADGKWINGKECELFPGVAGTPSYYFISDRFNVDDAAMYGAEATFEAELAPDVNLVANYTYTKTEQKSGKFKGQPLNEMPEHMFNITVDYDIFDALNIWSRLHYRSETSSFLSRTSMSTKTPGYEFIDVGFNYKFNPTLTGKFGVYNILDEKALSSSGVQELDGRRYGISLVANF